MTHIPGSILRENDAWNEFPQLPERVISISERLLSGEEENIPSISCLG
jgi:hypothetical protein